MQSMVILTAQNGMWFTNLWFKHVCIKQMVNRYIIFELLASELVHFDHRCASMNFTWRKIIDVWRKQCAMRLLLGLGLLLLLLLLLQGRGFGQRAKTFFLERAGSNAAEETKRKRR